MSLIMKKNRYKVSSYFLDMFGTKENDGINSFINSWKILIYLNIYIFMKQSGGAPHHSKYPIKELNLI